MRESLELLRLFLNVFLHSLGNSVSYTRIKCCRKNVLVAQFAVINQSGNCVGSSQFHFFGDSGCTSFQSAAEDAWEDENIVDLVRGNRNVRFLRLLHQQLLPDPAGITGTGFGHCEENGIFIHGSNHLLGNDARSRHPYEDVSAF